MGLFVDDQEVLVFEHNLQIPTSLSLSETLESYQGYVGRWLTGFYFTSDVLLKRYY
jgi:hypothetical protein